MSILCHTSASNSCLVSRGEGITFQVPLLTESKFYGLTALIHLYSTLVCGLLSIAKLILTMSGGQQILTVFRQAVGTLHEIEQDLPALP